jgi:hypothetical protein
MTYGLWDGRQVPVKVTKLNRRKLASELTVTDTIPFLCKKGAVIDVPIDFWKDFKN